MNTRLGHVAYTKLGIRNSTLIRFCEHFNIDITSNTKSLKNEPINKDSSLEPNFVYFLLENKTFILMYDQDYYSDKSIEIIAKKIGRTKDEIEEFFLRTPHRIDIRYPFRYISSYKINFDLSGKSNFLKYDKSHMYQGNSEYRRDSIK